MPTPAKGESQKDFMARCMGHPHAQKWKPAQRAAVCHSLFRSSSSKKPKGGK